MARRPVPIKVKPKDLTQIVDLLRGGIQQVRVVLRAVVLRQLADGVTAPRVAQTVPLTPKAIRQIAYRYNSSGLNAALYDKQRPGAHEVLDDARKQRIIAMVCSQAPEGRARSHAVHRRGTEAKYGAARLGPGLWGAAPTSRGPTDL